MNLPLKIGLFGIGLEAYWSQFDGLKARLEGYLQQVEDQLQADDTEIVNLGLVDSSVKAFAAGDTFRRECIDLLFIHVTTYALSATVIPVVRKLNVPVVMLNFVPEAAIDYAQFNQLPDRTQMTGEWLAFCSPCPVPELANVFKRTGLAFHEIIGVLSDPEDECWREIANWTQAARVAKYLSYNRMGLMGHYYSGMLDIYTDLTAVYATFGGHIEIVEVDELSALRDDVTKAELTAKRQEFAAEFETTAECSDYDLDRAARTSVALDRLVENYGLGSLAYYYKGTGHPSAGPTPNADTMSSIILGTSLLTARGVPVAGEFEIKNCLAMKIMDLFGAGGSFSEYYALDLADDLVLMGHDGPGHTRIAEGKAKVKPLQVYHGKVGDGLSIEMSVKNGPVTLLSVIEGADRGFEFLVAEGESVAGPILEIGNTNSRYRFAGGARHFVKSWNSHGPAHHCAIGLGHVAEKVKLLGEILAVKVNVVV